MAHATFLCQVNSRNSNIGHQVQMACRGKGRHIEVLPPSVSHNSSPSRAAPTRGFGTSFGGQIFSGGSLNFLKRPNILLDILSISKCLLSTPLNCHLSWKTRFFWKHWCLLQRRFSCTYLLCTISSCCTNGCTSSARVSVARVLTSDPRSSHAAAMSTRWCCSCSLFFQVTLGWRAASIRVRNQQGYRLFNEIMWE